jgi:NADPH:quinone reductase-like Zn-dependent oxidoreductase
VLQILLLGPVIRWITGKRIWVLAVQPNLKDMLHMAELCRAGKVVSVIDRRFSLSEVPQALRYLGEGHAKGKVIINVKGENES